MLATIKKSPLINFFTRHWFGLSQIIILIFALIFRLYQFGHTPVSLYWEEAALLYDAYSLSETAHDMHGNFLPILAVESFGDNKPSGYFYALIPFVKIFGLQDWVVKVPSLLAGLALVYGLGQLVYLIFNCFWHQDKSPKKSLLVPKSPAQILTLIAMFVAACNPSLVHLSHVGFETNLGNAFLLWGVIFLLQSFSSSKRFQWRFLLGELLLFFSFYTYHALRVVAPLLGLYLVITFIIKNRRQFRQQLATLISAFLLAIFCALPLFVPNNSSTLTSRFADTTVFSNLDVIVASNHCRERAHFSSLSRFTCHRYLYFAGLLGQNFARSLNPVALFFVGDGHLRHSPGPWGFFYPFELVFLFSGLIFIVRHFSKNRPLFLFLLFYFFVSLIPSVLTYDNPHLLRNLSALPIMMIFFALGIYQLATIFLPCWQKKSRQLLWLRSFSALIVALYFTFTAIFLQYYGTTYRTLSANDWQDGYREAIAALANLQQKYPDLPFHFTRSLGRPSIYYFLYNQIDPRQVQAATNETFEQSEFTTWDYGRSSFAYVLPSNAEQLVVLAPDKVQDLKLTEVTKIYNHHQDLVFVVGKLN